LLLTQSLLVPLPVAQPPQVAALDLQQTAASDFSTDVTSSSWSQAHHCHCIAALHCMTAHFPLCRALCYVIPDMTSTTSEPASLLLCLQGRFDAGEVCKQPTCDHSKYKKADTIESLVSCHRCRVMHLNKSIAQRLHLKYLLTALPMLKIGTACLLMSATASKVKVWRF